MVSEKHSLTPFSHCYTSWQNHNPGKRSFLSWAYPNSWMWLGKTPNHGSQSHLKFMTVNHRWVLNAAQHSDKISSSIYSPTLLDDCYIFTHLFNSPMLPLPFSLSSLPWFPTEKIEAIRWDSKSSYLPTRLCSAFPPVTRGKLIMLPAKVNLPRDPTSSSCFPFPLDHSHYHTNMLVCLVSKKNKKRFSWLYYTPIIFPFLCCFFLIAKLLWAVYTSRFQSPVSS